MASSWWDRFTFASSSLWNRIAEEGGLNDVVEELQRFDDDGMDVAHWLNVGASTLNQMIGGGSAALQMLIVPVHEANRAAGQAISEGVRDPRSLLRYAGTPGMIYGLSNADMREATIRSAETFATGGLTPDARQQMLDSGVPEHEVQRYYGPVSASDAITVGLDKVRNRWGTPAVMLAGPSGAAYLIGEAFNTQKGQWHNGSYLPAAFDLTTPDAGHQLWTSSGMTHQLIGEQLLLEATLDPMNFLSGPLAAVLKGRKAAALVGTAKRADPAAVTEAMDAIGSPAVEANRRLRGSQWMPGRGLWNQQAFLDAMVHNRGTRRVLEQFAEESSPAKINSLLSRYGMAEGEGADVMSAILSRVDTPADVAKVLNAGAFRDRAAIDEVLELLESGVDTMPAAEGLRTLTGTGSNILERTVFEYGANGVLRADHPLQLGGKGWVKEAIRRADSDAGVLPDDPASLSARWEALAKADRRAIETDIDRHAAALEAAGRMRRALEPGTDLAPTQYITRMRRAPSARQARLAGLRTAEPDPNSRAAAVAEFLRTYRTPAIRIRGKTLRTSPSVWLMTRPGLVFELHGMDAMSKFDGIVRYTDGIIGSQGVNGVRFIDDPRVATLRERFSLAGAATRNPEQLRAELVDELQTLAVSRIAQKNNIAEEAADLLARRGMLHAGQVARALNEVSRGYTTALMEDGRAEFLTSHPGAIRQTANHIPLMDLKALDTAFKSYGIRTRAITSTDDLLSVASMETLIKEAEGTAGANMSGQAVVRRVGRGRPTRAAHTMIDLADAVNTLFKKSVLVRLGYPIRNLSEAHLSAMASGTGWLRVMAHADIPTLLGNFMQNMYTSLPRWKDRFKTFNGLTMDEDAFIAAAKGTQLAIDQAGNNLAHLLSVVSDPVELNRLVKWANDPARPDRQAQAVAMLRYLTDLRLKVLHHVDADMAARGLPSQTPGVAAQADGSAVYFHTDSTGALAGLDSRSTDRLNGPLAVTSDRVVAQNQVDFAWGDGGRWQDVDISVPGSLAGGMTFPRLLLTDINVEMLTDLAAEVHTAGRLAKWRITQNGELRLPSDAAARELLADLAAKKAAAPSQTVAATPFSAAQHPRYLYGRLEDRLVAGMQWHAHQRAVRSTAKTHHVQYRADPSSPWVDWTGRQPFGGSARTRANYEWRTSEKSAANPKGKPGVVQIDAWGPSVDLTDPATKAALLQHHESVLSEQIVDAAIAGDLAAQDRISQVLAKEGYYRVVLPDSAEWNGTQTLLHPDGVGPQAYQRYLAQQVEAQVKAGVMQDVPSDLLEGLSKMQVRALNRGSLTEVPGAADLIPKAASPNLAKILKDGGVEALVAEQIDNLARLRSQQDTIHAAYLARRAKAAKVAKKSGLKEKEWKFVGRYATYRVPDALHGPDGGIYALVASGNLNHANTYARGAHMSDLLMDMERGVMQPQEIHPGDPRYFEALANLLGRHYRDTAGAHLERDIDPLFRWALGDGDRVQLEEDALRWALHTPEGREWVKGLGLRTQATREEAVEAAEKAVARRGQPAPAVTAEQRREALVRPWQSTMGSPVMVDDVDVADVIRAQFNFAENWVLPNSEVRDLFLRGEATAEALEAAYRRNPWELHTFNGLLSPTDAATRRALRARRANDQAMGRAIRGLTGVGDRVLTKIGSGPETRMARHPVFQAIAEADLKQRIRFAEETTGRELSMSEVLALRSSSQKYALKRMEETLYTLKSRNGVDDFLRFVMPFFPAWRNTLHRWGRFALENPGGVEKVSRFYSTTVGQMGWFDYQSGDEVNLEEVDPKEVYTLLPGVTHLPIIGPFLTKSDPVLEQALRRTKVSPRSLDVIFQGDIANPGVGPWVAAPAQAILDHQSWIKETPIGKRLAKYLLPMGPNQTGSGGLDAAMSFLPSALKPVVARIFETQEWSAMSGKVSATYFANGYDRDPLTGELKPMEQQRNEIDSAIARMMTVKTMMYLVSPVSAQQVGDAEFFAGQYRSLRDTLPTLDDADAAFLERFGDQAFYYTQSSTFNLTGGLSTAATVQNQKELGEVAGEAIDRFDNPRLLAWFENMGPNGERLDYGDTDYNEYARNWQLKNAPTATSGPYRGGKTPEQSILDAKVRLGWHYYDRGMEILDATLQSEGYITGTAEFYKERARRSPDIVQRTTQGFPEWGDERQKIDAGKTEDTAEFFQWALTKSDWAQTHGDLPVVQSVLAYLQIREVARAAMAARVAADPRWPRSLSAQGNEDLYQKMQAARSLLSRDSPAFEDWVNTYFRSDDISLGRTPMFPEAKEQLR